MKKNVKTEECGNCGAEAAVVRGAYAMKESGLKNVVLHGIDLVRCEQCGNVDPIIPRLNDLMRTLALAVITKPYRLLGNEVRFLRKFLGMTQDELSRWIHVDKTTLSKWENDEDPVGEQSDLLIRALAVIRGDGLHAKVDEVVGQFAAIRKARRSVGIEVHREAEAEFGFRYV